MGISGGVTHRTEQQPRGGQPGDLHGLVAAFPLPSRKPERKPQRCPNPGPSAPSVASGEVRIQPKAAHRDSAFYFPSPVRRAGEGTARCFPCTTLLPLQPAALQGQEHPTQNPPKPREESQRGRDDRATGPGESSQLAVPRRCPPSPAGLPLSHSSHAHLHQELPAALHASQKYQEAGI